MVRTIAVHRPTFTPSQGARWQGNGERSYADEKRDALETLAAMIERILNPLPSNVAKPMWNLTTLAATFFEDGNALAHQMGCQHPGYTRESTEEKWAHCADRLLLLEDANGAG